MIDPKTQAWLDQEDADVTRNIREHGWFIQYVGADPDERSTSFAYTVGLFGLGHPELLVLGLGADTAGTVLNVLGDRIRAGADLVPGQLITFDTWQHRMVAEEVPNPGQIAFAANRHYRRPAEASVPVLQLTYDDLNGRFPWDPGHSIPDWIQPRPGTFTA